jgi:hypothetical protein
MRHAIARRRCRCSIFAADAAATPPAIFSFSDIDAALFAAMATPADTFFAVSPLRRH